MTSIAATGQVPASYPLPSLRTPTADPGSQASAAVLSPAVTVSLGQAGNLDNANTYSRQALLASAQMQYTWENDQSGSLKNLMQAQISAGSGIARFQGLGAALLEQLAGNGGQSISQSVFASQGDAPVEPDALKLQRDSLWAHPTNSLNFTLKTASGASVQLSLASTDQGLGVSAKVLDGKLTADELKGLGALAESLQSAIDGLSQVPPKIQLDGLMQLDPTLFSALQLNATLQTAEGDQRFALQLDDSVRSLNLQGPSGNLALSLDARQAGLLGSKAQRQSAISNYLTQFDAAQQRGKGNQNLMSLFKDAFVQLNRADDSTSAAQNNLTAKDRSLLSGLADFSASVSEPQRYNNPMQPTEVDSFSFSVAQTSQFSSASALNRSVQQDQQSSLKASYHQSLNPLVALALSSDSTSQNYRYVEVDDQSSSSTRMAYRKGKLVEASATQHATQNQRVRTYNDGNLVEDLRTPASVTRARNLLGMLNSAFEQERLALRDHRAFILEAQLEPQRRLWLLQSDPGQIAA